MSKRPRTERKESPKGLIAFTRQDVSWGEHGTEMKETGPGRFVLKGTPPLETAQSMMVALMDIARDTIEAAGKDPNHCEEIKRQSNDADPAYVAAKLLDDLWMLQGAIGTVTRAKDIEEVRGSAYRAVTNALAACFTMHALTVVEAEVDIIHGIGRARGASTGGRAKAEKIVDRDMAMAERFLERRAKPAGLSDTALKIRVGREWSPPLKERAAIDAINRGLDHLKRRKKVCSLPSQSGK